MNKQGAGGIAWTDATWGPVRGCSRVSPGCQHCYAEAQALRVYRCDRGRGVPIGQGSYDGLVAMVGGSLCAACDGTGYLTDIATSPTTYCRRCLGLGRVDGEARWTGAVRLVPEQLDAPLHMREPRRIFVNSMSDLFHESLLVADIARVFDAMRRAHWHAFQVLTKRADRLPRVMAVVRDILGLGRADWPLPNVWLGVSVEGRDQLGRLDHLRAAPAAVRFVSFEPLLEDLGAVDLRGIDLAIIGGESGKLARPCDVAWIRSLVAQCREAGTLPFVKQLGARPTGLRPECDRCNQQIDLRGRHGLDCAGGRVLKHSHGGDPAEWPEDLRVRELPMRP